MDSTDKTHEWFEGRGWPARDDLQEPSAKEERNRLRDGLTFCLAVAIPVLILALAGCASAPVPECAEVEAALINSPRGPLLVFDMDGIQQLQARQLDLQAGKCRLPAPGEKV